ncbi:MAG TPA: SRPBCC domain-containing protein [Thermoplasmata archaeon]|nr:SRPBCC domain-containing protein [Thermoplasmata archaeon]
MKQTWRKESMDGQRRAVKISREFDFPREWVFQMLTDPKKAAKVWGPEGAVKLVFELDPRPGGAITIHDQYEGKTAKTTGTITEFVEPELLVFRSVTTPEEGVAPWEALQTVTLEELTPTRTRVTVLVQILATGSFPGGVESLEEGFQGGWGETFDMLQRQLR